MLKVSFIKKEDGATHHLIYSITTSFGFDMRAHGGLKGLSYLILSNGFQLVSYQFRFLHGSQKMRNLIRIALKWLFFVKYWKNCPAVKVLHLDPGMLCDML